MPFLPRSPLRRLAHDQSDGRRREDADGVRALSFELDAYEFVQASDELGLLRVAGRWVADVDRALQDIVLTVSRDGELVELDPLPDLRGAAPLATPAGEAWRGAFTVAVELADDPRSEFALAAGDDVSVELPRPSEWGVGADGPVDDAAGVADNPEPVAGEVESLPDETELAVAHSVDELEEEVARLRVELQEARTEIEVERGRREALEDDLRSAIAMQEAELRTASMLAEQGVRRGDSRRDQLDPSPAQGEQVRPAPQAIDDEFLDRLERAKRMSEAAP